MKKLLILSAMIIFLVACSEDEATEEISTDQEKQSSVEQTTSEPNENEPTQEELNRQLKENAIEADFVKINGGEVEEDTRLKATGSITALYEQGIRDGDFMLTVKQGENEYGVYHIINMNTEEISLQEGQQVTVYGTYKGRAEDGMPSIVATVIE